jgi:hypothetical protein
MVVYPELLEPLGKRYRTKSNKAKVEPQKTMKDEKYEPHQQIVREHRH